MIVRNSRKKSGIIKIRLEENDKDCKKKENYVVFLYYWRNQMKKLTKEERELWYKFRIPAGNNLQRCKVNQPKLSGANSWEHELKKLKKAHDCLRQGHKYIMEAQEIKTGRIRDYVCLTERIAWEWEKSKQATKKKEQEGAYDSPNCIVEVVKMFEKE